jgi:hypothetical protein
MLYHDQVVTIPKITLTIYKDRFDVARYIYVTLIYSVFNICTIKLNVLNDISQNKVM